MSGDSDNGSGPIGPDEMDSIADDFFSGKDIGGEAERLELLEGLPILQREEIENLRGPALDALEMDAKRLRKVAQDRARRAREGWTTALLTDRALRLRRSVLFFRPPRWCSDRTIPACGDSRCDTPLGRLVLQRWRLRSASSCRSGSTGWSLRNKAMNARSKRWQWPRGLMTRFSRFATGSLRMAKLRTPHVRSTQKGCSSVHLKNFLDKSSMRKAGPRSASRRLNHFFRAESHSTSWRSASK